MKRAPHIKMTEKQFRASKREEFKHLREVFREFWFGSAYLPDAESRGATREIYYSMTRLSARCLPWWKNS